MFENWCPPSQDSNIVGLRNDYKLDYKDDAKQVGGRRVGGSFFYSGVLHELEGS